MTSTETPLDLCADHFLIRVVHVGMDDILNPFIDPLRRIKRFDLAQKLTSNYHLVEIDANDIPNKDQAMEIFYDRIRDAEEGDYFEDAVESRIAFMSKGDYEGNHKDLYPTNMPVIDDL